MTQLLLTTKLFFPRARSKIVSRPRLIEQLNAGLGKPLTLISAPAGYGKTTLLSAWRTGLGTDYPLAWLSLDPDDNNLVRFLTYVSAALETLDPELPKELVSRLQLPQVPPVEELITILINSVTAYHRDFVLILDDCHVITEPAIHSSLAYLLDHMPPKMHLVMLTRSDPPIYLAKLRARGDMVELRTDDLRFTREEAADYLNTVMDLHLSGENVSALDLRTEGWIAGLQMAALSMQGKADMTSFIRAFAGSNRYILDFLSEEVLQQQPEPVQTFLLRTSILNRLSGPLCDAVLGGSKNGAQILTELERKNLFLIPLDDEREWYRYHHLFTDLLFQCLKQTEPTLVNVLYERAATWLEQNGYLEDAIGYALKAQNYDLATQLMNQIRTNLLNHGEIHRLLQWIKILPQELVRSQPELSFSYASYLTVMGYFEAADQWLKLAESGMGQPATSDRHVSLDEHRFIGYRSVYARYRGDFAAAVALAERALELVPASMVRDWGATMLFAGQAYFYAGDTEATERILIDAIPTNLASGHLEAYVESCNHLAKLRLLQGRLHDARLIYEQAVRTVSEQEKPVYAGIEHAGLGDLKREWDQLEDSAVEIEKGVELAEASDRIFCLTDVYLARFHLAVAQKDWETASNYLQKAEKVALRSPTSIENEQLQAWRARLHLSQGNLAEAGQWAESVEAKMEGKVNTGPFDPQSELVLLTLARVWLAQGKTDQAASLLDRVRSGAEKAGRGGRAFEALMLQALADQAAGKGSQAVEKLIRVLAWAKPEGYIRLFIDEGARMAKLLYQVTIQTTPEIREYAERLLSAHFQEQAERPASSATTSPGNALIEPLSKREIEVLRLMADGCANKEISFRLFISIGTVKRHVVNILRKLNADNRTQAVAIARELEII